MQADVSSLWHCASEFLTQKRFLMWGQTKPNKSLCVFSYPCWNNGQTFTTFTYRNQGDNWYFLLNKSVNTFLIIAGLSIRPSIHPSIHTLSAAFAGLGCRGSSLSREAQTSLSAATSTSSSRRIPRPAQRHSPSSVSWVFPGASYHKDGPWTGACQPPAEFFPHSWGLFCRNCSPLKASQWWFKQASTQVREIKVKGERLEMHQLHLNVASPTLDLAWPPAKRRWRDSAHLQTAKSKCLSYHPIQFLDPVAVNHRPSASASLWIAGAASE